MKLRFASLICAAAVAVAAFSIHADETASDKAAPPAEEKVADVTGSWIGEWGPFNPAQNKTLSKETCKELLAKVTREGETWHAVFEGECGRPYKYTITMDGRPAGGVVLFKGTVDLGPKDGGVFDWVGRATDKEFVGFFTSSHYVGTFALARSNELAKAGEAAPTKTDLNQKP